MGTDLTKTVKRTSNIPRKDADTGSLGQQVVLKWKANPTITLLWKTAINHETDVNAFISTLYERNTTGGGRKEITGKLAALDTEIDEGVKAIKAFLIYKYSKEHGPDYYPQFGIERQAKNFVVPRDHDKRLNALKLIIEAIPVHGYDNATYNLLFWRETRESYDTLIKSAALTDGTVSNKVGTKNALRTNITKTHNALIHILKGNYPDDWKNVMREWGFQKEKY
jgi:hypothetical protein